MGEEMKKEEKVMKETVSASEQTEKKEDWDSMTIGEKIYHFCCNKMDS